MRAPPTTDRQRSDRIATIRVATMLLALMLSCSSCFTMSVWGFDVEESPDIVTGEPETVMVYDPETEWSWKLFGLRVLATPFTLVLDCATAPLQAFFLWNDDDEHADDGA